MGFINSAGSNNYNYVYNESFWNLCTTLIYLHPKINLREMATMVYCCTVNSQISESVFVRWLEHFQKLVNATKDDPVLLLIGKSSMHSALKACTFPNYYYYYPTLDVSFYSVLKIEYCNYLRSYEGERFTTNELAVIYNIAYIYIYIYIVATPAKVMKGCR